MEYFCIWSEWWGTNHFWSNGLSHCSRQSSSSLQHLTMLSSKVQVLMLLFDRLQIDVMLSLVVLKWCFSLDVWLTSNRDEDSPPSPPPLPPTPPQHRLSDQSSTTSSTPFNSLWFDEDQFFKSICFLSTFLCTLQVYFFYTFASRSTTSSLTTEGRAR